MKNLDPKLLAREGHGAIQCDESKDIVPLIVTICGPIKYWWGEGNWGTPTHKKYIEWRDAVTAVLIKNGCAVYSPHKAIRGPWNEKLQDINNVAIRSSNFIVVLTPENIPAEGTNEEIRYAWAHKVETFFCPPSKLGLIQLVEYINDFRIDNKLQ